MEPELGLEPRELAWEPELRRGVPAEGSWDQNSVSVIPTSATPERGDLGQPAFTSLRLSIKWTENSMRR